MPSMLEFPWRIWVSDDGKRGSGKIFFPETWIGHGKADEKGR